MRTSNIIKTGILSGILSVSAVSCKKAPLKPINTVRKEYAAKLDSLITEGKKITNDTTYHFFGRDTLEIGDAFVKNTSKAVKDLDKTAKKHTPKFETGKSLHTEMIPKSGGGFDMIPVIKPDYVPQYVNQKTVVTSDKVFTSDGKDMYIPVEYYGQNNPKAVKKKK